MKKKYWYILLLIAIIILAMGIWQYFYLKKAHSTFDNYFAFRGCQELLSKTDTYGICKTKNGKTIKIVLYQGRWFLDGDLPNGKFLDW